jgi:hypothetical protein
MAITWNTIDSYLYMKWVRNTKKSRVNPYGSSPSNWVPYYSMMGDFEGLVTKEHVRQTLQQYIPNWVDLYIGSMDLYYTALAQNPSWTDADDEMEHVQMCVLIEAIERMATNYVKIEQVYRLNNKLVAERNAAVDELEKMKEKSLPFSRVQELLNSPRPGMRNPPKLNEKQLQDFIESLEKNRRKKAPKGFPWISLD